MRSSILGLALVAIAPLEYLIRLATRRAPTSTRPYDAIVLFGTGVAVAAALLLPPAPGWAAALAGGITLVWFASTRMLLRFQRRPGPLGLAVGDPLPRFTATTTSGTSVTDAEIAAHAPALLVLYRGSWCPYCRSQLGELEREHDQFRAAGLTLYALSTERPEDARPLEARLRGQVVFLSDESGGLLDILGVRDRVPWYDRVFFGAKQEDIAMPCTLLVGAGGRVRYLHRARRIDDRPPLDTILRAARPAG